MHWLVTTSLLLLNFGWICGHEIRSADYKPDSESELIGCLKSSNPEEIKKLRLNIFKKEILLRLGLDKEPENLSFEVPITSYKEQISRDYGAIRAGHLLQDKEVKPCVEVDKRTSRLVVYFPEEVETEHSQSAATDGNYLVDTLRFKFNIDLNGHQDVTEADLRLYKLVVDDSSAVAEERVDIYNWLPGGENYYGESQKIHAVAGNVKTDKNGYTIFNAAEAINTWKVKTPSLKGELILQVEIRTGIEGFSLPPKIQFASDNATTQLVIRTILNEPETRSMYDPTEVDSLHKRNAESYNTGIIDCALQPLSINFRKDFNWTWVLHPEVLTLNYCKGLCGRANAENQHSEFLARRATILSNPVGASEPCCIPNSFESATLSLAPLFGPDGTHLEKLDKITITSCICR